MNILGNANKFTENGQIDLNLTTQMSGSDKIILTTVVSDTGSGISETDLKRSLNLIIRVWFLMKLIILVPDWG